MSISSLRYWDATTDIEKFIACVHQQTKNLKIIYNRKNPQQLIAISANKNISTMGLMQL
jgi:adenylate kinase family enzyme